MCIILIFQGMNKDVLINPLTRGIVLASLTTRMRPDTVGYEDLISAKLKMLLFEVNMYVYHPDLSRDE